MAPLAQQPFVETLLLDVSEHGTRSNIGLHPTCILLQLVSLNPAIQACFFFFSFFLVFEKRNCQIEAQLTATTGEETRQEENEANFAGVLARAATATALLPPPPPLKTVSDR